MADTTHIVGARAKANAEVLADALKAAAVASLTENSGAIGGTNNGDLPDLTTPDATINAAAIREVAAKLNALLTALRAAGLISS